MFSNEYIEKVRKDFMEKIVEDIISVQPMPVDAFINLYKLAKPREELIAEGYEPVCPHIGLMWIKKGN